ncbi:hypothetical protein QWI17_13555 [Gilvimarinus sp. SDUM040013]|uniref:Lipoprotein n=1 Tax=Gilvimarinus gilvus TaxID=3058038 RepID=A0ABU4RTJ0_9GAMM|nr:hypothetical protein [Gilvimarinus sp. SDUM040013]MDO3386868.1 hypothetical protein [Gilvimarinus sp. SDUM040013]MDX6848202.1 hypothetical protein [Gilvimarinus sp. SDUM040013]
MWLVTYISTGPTIRVASLPSTAAPSENILLLQHIDRTILETLRKDRTIELVAPSAIAARPSNPYPYFFAEFSADWVLEVQFSSTSLAYQVELTLVDARTGLEITAAHALGSNKADLSAKVATTLTQTIMDLKTEN